MKREWLQRHSIRYLKPVSVVETGFFIVTLTWEALAHRQPDLAQQGYFFSFVVIGLGNLMVLLIGWAWLTGEVGPIAALGWCWGETDKVLCDFLRWMS